MCQYDTDTPAQDHPHPYASILQKNEVEIKSHNSHDNWQILPLIDFGLYFMIIYLCIKYEANTQSFFKKYRKENIF